MSNYDDGPSGGQILAGLVILAVVVVLGGWCAVANGYLQNQYFGPKQEAQRREILEESHSYTAGQVQRLNNTCTEISKADETGKQMLYQIIDQEYASWDSDSPKVPEYLRPCLKTARQKVKEKSK